MPDAETTVMPLNRSNRPRRRVRVIEDRVGLRIAMGIGVAVALGAIGFLGRAARAQPDAAPSTPASRPTVASPRAPAVGDGAIGIRARHPLVVGADVGWNTLAGLGLDASYTAGSHLAFDVGAGYVLSGAKGGARVRWNFTTANLTPFVALGGVWSQGHADPQTFNQKDGDSFTFHVGPAAYAQAVAGLDYQDSDRMHLRVEAGWAQALRKRDLHVVSGTPESDEWNEVRLVAGGGVVVGGSIGYAF
jgi:hypothetical protein